MSRELYRYRTIDSALKEIEYLTFHFASLEELNDPLEGYVIVYWRGDKPAWEALIKNYACSCLNAIELYLLAGNENELWNESLLVDIHAYDGLPIAKLYEEVGNELLADEAVKRIISVYGDNELKCSADELQLLLRIIHNNSLNIVLKCLKENKLIPQDEVEHVLSVVGKHDVSSIPFESLANFDKEKDRKIIVDVFVNMMNDMMESLMITYGIQESGFAYGENDIRSDDLEKNRARQHRNWMALIAEFPKMYINQLVNMIYPQAYYVCFSGNNDNSAMWGNYANNHKGVCMVYKSEYEEGNDLLGYYKEMGIINPRKVEYGGEAVERNFFETLGRLTISQIQTWLTGKNEIISKYYDEFYSSPKLDAWRKNYWREFGIKNYRKLDAWSYEDEYRLHIENTFYEYTDSDSEIDDKGKHSRNLKYDKNLLVGVIFGINTSEYDKARIIKALHTQDMDKKVEYYQAEYNETTQKIRIRKKEWLERVYH